MQCNAMSPVFRCNASSPSASPCSLQRTPASAASESQSLAGFSTQTSTLRHQIFTFSSLVAPLKLLYFNTQAVESAVARQFSPAVRQPLVAEWFRSSLPSPPPGEEELLDRAGQLRLLQHLLETTHASMARAAGLLGEEEGGLFLTQHEIHQLNSYYIRESLEQGEERVLYSVGGK